MKKEALTTELSDALFLFAALVAFPPVSFVEFIGRESLLAKNGAWLNGQDQGLTISENCLSKMLH